MRFWKMHGLGNDYIVMDNRDGQISDNRAAELAKKLCERRFSVGADGLLLVCNSTIADIKMRIFNADGSEAEMCGNAYDASASTAMKTVSCQSESSLWKRYREQSRSGLLSRAKKSPLSR
jgi:diaminopimelate epimerase